MKKMSAYILVILILVISIATTTVVLAQSCESPTYEGFEFNEIYLEDSVLTLKFNQNKKIQIATDEEFKNLVFSDYPEELDPESQELYLLTISDYSDAECFIRIKSGIFRYSGTIHHVSAAHEHNDDNFVKEVITDPKCTESGSYYAICTECEYTKLMESEPTGHDYKETQMVYSTCSEEGYKKLQCTSCGEMTEITIPILEHNYETVEHTDANCISFEKEIKVCSSCGHQIEEEIGNEYGPHNYVIVKKDSASCIKEGYLKNKCSICNDVTEEIIGKTDHNYSTKESVSSGDLVVEYTCKTCSDSCKKVKISNYVSKYGYVGTLKVPSVGLTVRCCNNRYSKGYNEQEICNMEDMAWVEDVYFDKIVIGDHVNQGFNKIKSISVGDVCYFAGKTYVCKDRFNGINDGNGMIFGPNGINMYCEYDCDLILYTCNSIKHSITLVVFDLEE